MELRSISVIYSDCTSDYEVVFEKPYRVRDLINEVLTRNEWGYIGIYKEGIIFGKPVCEYRRNTIITEPLPEKYMNKIIKRCRANGGWSRMDYIIYL